MSTGAAPEAFIPLNGSAGNSAPVTGGKRHKLKLVTRKQARKLLKKLGRKMRGGEANAPGAIVAPPKEEPATTATGSTGGRKTRRHAKRHSRRSSRRSLFGLRY